MRLTTKLTIAITLLLAVGASALGWGVVEASSALAISRLDRRIVSYAERTAAAPQLPAQITVAPTAAGIFRFDFDPRNQRWFAISELVGEEPLAASLPLPGTPEFDQRTGEPSSLTAVDGSEWQVLAFTGPQNRPLFAVSSLEELNSATTSLIWTVTLLGTAVTALGAGVSWLISRRSLAPVSSMIEKTDAVAEGNFTITATARPAKDSELGKLSRSLDRMIAQLQADLDEREQLAGSLRRFVADAAHELRTPIATIQGYSELHASGGTSDPERLDRAMQRINWEATRMARLVDDLVLLTRLDRSPEPEWDEVDLAEVVDGCAADWQVVNPDRELVTQLPPHPVLVLGDRQQLHQVVSNLLRNAAVHCPADSRTVVVLGQDAAGTTLDVHDSGPGVPAAERSQVFERFYRLDRSRSRDRGGAGLGLAIAAAIVRAHSGSIEVTDGPLGGADFRVWLPRAPHPKTSSNAQL